MNIFEGARRILWVGHVAVFLLTFGVATYEIHQQWDSMAWVSAASFTTRDYANWQRLPVESGCPFILNSHRIEKRTPKGRPVLIFLCYDEISTPSEKVRATDRFQLPEAAAQDLDRAAEVSRWDEVWEEYLDQAKWFIAWLLASTIVSYAIGWIARGFLGVPRGMDVKPLQPE